MENIKRMSDTIDTRPISIAGYNSDYDTEDYDEPPLSKNELVEVLLHRFSKEE